METWATPATSIEPVQVIEAIMATERELSHRVGVPVVLTRLWALTTTRAKKPEPRVGLCRFAR